MSSSRIGARPVQSALRWPRKNLSSARARRSSASGRVNGAGRTVTFRRYSEGFLEVALFVFVYVPLRSELLPALAHLVAAGQSIALVGEAPDDILVVLRAGHG